MSLAPRPIRLLVFDLDDTLYLERDYVRSGFAHIASVVAQSAPYTADTIRESLDQGFAEGVRGTAFDRLLERFPQLRQRWTVAQLVEQYRNHQPTLTLALEAAQMLRQLRADGARLAVLTDGPPVSQRAKYKALGLPSLVDYVVFSEDAGIEYRKPHVRAFQEISRRFHVPAAHSVYVGDNPAKDFFAGRQLGWHTIRLRIPEQLRFALEPPSGAYAADIEMTSIDELSQYLSACSRCFQ